MERTIPLVSMYAKTSALSAVHHLVILSDREKSEKNKTHRHPENNVRVYFHGWSCQEFECKVPAVPVCVQLRGSVNATMGHRTDSA